MSITITWLYAQAIPLLMGIPIFRYSQITPNIILGPQHSRKGKCKLENSGINYSINLRDEFDDVQYGLALKHYCYLPTVDDEAPTLEQLNTGVAFIREAITKDESVYIHCAGGIGRAPTLVAAYLISQGLKCQEAIEQIKIIRPFIIIMPTQLEQLKRFEEYQISFK